MKRNADQYSDTASFELLDSIMPGLDEILGYKYAKDVFSRFYNMYENRKTFVKQGIDLPKSILLYGDANRGKTFMAHIFAEAIEKLGVKTIWIVLEEFMEGENLRIIRDSLREDNVCLILDDIRMENLPEIIIKAIDEAQKEKEFYLVVGISDDRSFYNQISKWPYAGLFEMRLHIDRLSYYDAQELIAEFLKGKDVIPMNTEDIAAMLMGCHSYRKAQRVLNHAYINSMHRFSGLSSEDIVDAFNYFYYDYDNREGIFSTDENDIDTAFHEAGHTVIRAVLNDDVGFVSMLRKNKSNAENSGITFCFNDIFDMENEMVVSLGGMAAVNTFLRKFAPDTTRDLTKATELAKQLVTLEGYYGIEYLSTNKESNDALTNDQEHAVYKLMKEKYEEACNLLTKNKAMVDYIASELLSKGYMFRSEIIEFLKRSDK